MIPFQVLDLFSGFGSYSLGLERTQGFETVAFCEILPYPRKILHKHWPHVPIFEDVKDLTAERLRSAGIVPDFIVAGWPCQGNSPAGTGLGMGDPRSGLWSEIRRLAGEVRPRGLLLENSSNLLTINGGADFGRVLGDLAALGFDAEWHCLPAAAFDAPHIRDRVWIIATRADTDGPGVAGLRGAIGVSQKVPQFDGDGYSGPSPDVEGIQRRARLREVEQVVDGHITTNGGCDTFDADGFHIYPHWSEPTWLPTLRPEPARVQGRPVFDGDFALANLDRLAPIGTAIARQERVSWQSIADFRGVVHGDAEGLDGFAVITEKVANRVGRIHGLGNLNPPIIPEMLGRAILAAPQPPTHAQPPTDQAETGSAPRSRPPE